MCGTNAPLNDRTLKFCYKLFHLCGVYPWPMAHVMIPMIFMEWDGGP